MSEMKEDADSDVPHANTALDDILSQISDLDKWRRIFNARGFELQDGIKSKDTLLQMMADHQENLNTIKALQPSRLSYIEILQTEVQRNQDVNNSTKQLKDCGDFRTKPQGKPEDNGEEGTGRPSSSSRPSRENTTLLTSPYSIPRALALSPSLGGLPVAPEMATNLRKVLFGNTYHIFNYEWKKSFFKFRESCSDLSYALETECGGARAIQMVVQANIVKFLLFTRNASSDCSMQSLREVGEKEQEQALAAALTDILWTAGEEQSATVSLVTSEHSLTQHLDYKPDNLTERLQLFNFSEKEDVRKFIYEHIQCFKEEGSHGVILFLYSLIFSRTFQRLSEDLDSTTSHLLYPGLGNFVCCQALMNLLLTGRASPNMFNGTLQYDEHGDPLKQPLHGILSRSDVGYLYWSREQLEHSQLPKVGSMLKTPKLPIWVCSINGTYSILFSPKRSLLSDWKMEHLFDMYFYNGQPSQISTARLTIDTHSHHWEMGDGGTLGDPEKRFPSVEMTIRTKWQGAAIDWNGTVPFF